MILIATNERDITSDFIVVELRKRGLPFYRLNSETLPTAAVRFDPRPDKGWEVDLDGKSFRLSDVTAAYYRRPGIPQPVTGNDAPTREYLAGEWSAITRSLWNALEGRWLNSPFSILRAEDKPRQLALAVSLGFDVPETLVSNDFNVAQSFVATRNIVGKPLRHSLIERGDAGEVLFTARIAPLTSEDRDAVRAAPVIYQREVKKVADIRATVIGDRVFAAAILSQAHKDTEVDWRSGTRLDIGHEAVELPRPVVDRCLALTRSLGLRFGAIDLIEDAEGGYWFLEINPNGQWAWIERRTGLGLASAIVDELVSIGKQAS